ncbi:MAG TPA: UDP-N-acetylmuramate dehydrogenase [Dehalococcoidia bacterium]|nr:UDP-N-acetylmuramate dehydrogenase [Dehalococcoidia bacterium]
MNDPLITELRKIATVKVNEPMARHTTFGVGGAADAYIAVKSEDQLRRVFAIARQREIEAFIFGSGSNILVGDGGIRGLVIDNQHSEITGPEKNGEGYKVRAGSGMSFATLARRMSSAGYAGLEWAAGIPGSLGGAVVTNAGAYGHSLSDVLKGARLADSYGDVIEVSAEELDLSYRNSAFTSGKIVGEIVLSVDLRLQKGDAKALKQQVKEFDVQRRGAQPPGRNCGSVFKNPPERPAWQYVDDVGLRGHRIGNAQFSELHSNFILNLGSATAKDVTSLIELAQAKVREKFGVDLETEVMFVGEFA